MSVPTMKKYRVEYTETVVETYEVYAMTRKQALDKIYNELPHPVNVKHHTPTPVVTIIEQGEKK